MKIGHYRARFVPGYKGHGKRCGFIKFGNGFSFRLGPFCWHFWKLGPNDYNI